MLGNSAAMQAVSKDIVAAARTSAKVLILGETGVGKDVVARAIHATSARGGQPFVAINCSGIPETLLESELFGHTRGSFTGAVRDKLGLVQQAHRGTLFLDELGEMSLRMQASLLRFLETGEVQRVGSEAGGTRSDVRVIAATNRNLRQQIADGAFREDLYYRLNVIQIDVPPLRNRGDDIMLLFHHFLAEAALTHGLGPPTVTPDAAQLLVAHTWPGNVRELRNVTERLVLGDHAGDITPDHLPADILGIQRRPEPSNEADLPDRRDSERPQPDATSRRVAELFERLVAGDDSWGVVQEMYKGRELTRNDLAGLIDLGLRETRGSYRALIRLFGLDDAEYKRFHSFLYQAKCNLPVGPYRRGKVRRFTDFVAGRRTSHVARSA
jgi:DNA-binding NtrC family response regulator